VHRRELLPYDAGTAALSAALNDAGVGFKFAKRQMEGVTAWLPTKGGQPVASSPLIAEPPRSRAKAKLAPWSVTALRLTPQQVVEILCACVGKETLAAGVVVGADLAFWAAIMRLAGATVARQQFLPDVVMENETWRACWKPVFAGCGAETLGKLAKAMPAVARALTADGESPPQTPVLTVMSGFLGRAVDYLVRSTVSLQHAPGAGRRPQTARHGRRKSARVAAFDSLHDQWLEALRTADGTMEGDPKELADFALEVREWQRPVTVSVATPFRLSFRLEEPTVDGGGGERVPSAREPWYVRYLLQATDDPSLLIEAEEVWHARGRKASVLKCNGFDAKEYLLLSLGRASGVCPRIEVSLKTATPGGYRVNVTGAHEFLTEEAAALEQAGFGVMLPAWWTCKGTKLRLIARANVSSPKMQGGSGLSLDEVVQFDWDVALGDERLSYEELQTLAKLKAPLVNVRGQWVQMSAEEIQAALNFWKKKDAGQATVREIVQMALGAAEAPGPVAFDGVMGTGWIADLLAQLDGRDAFEEVAPPQRLHRGPASVPGARLLVALFPAAVGSGRVPGRRHGARQNHPDVGTRATRLALQRQAPGAVDLPHICGRQLAEGGDPLHARVACHGAPRRYQSQGCGLQEGSTEAGHGHLQLRLAASGFRDSQGRTLGRCRAR
jgi:hypothetical protein